MNTLVEPLLFKNYIALITNTINSNIVRNFYARVNGIEKDITQNGELSCAYYVSLILNTCQLIKKPHLTVDGLINDIKESGWYKIPEIKTGAIIEWEAIMDENSESHKHIGFAISSDEAISNSSKLGTPQKHPLCKPSEVKRKISHIYWHNKLTDAYGANLMI